MLGLVVQLSDSVPEVVRERILFHIAGIAAMTILINGSTCGALIKKLGLSHTSESTKTFFDRAAAFMLSEIEQEV